MSIPFNTTQNSKANYRVYNFRTSDLRNFLSLISEEFKKRNMELIPDGLILKKPRDNHTDYGNTSIDVIGIPFKRVFGRTTLNYYRIKLSEFERKFAIQLGNINAPIRLKRPSDNEQFRLRVLKALSDRTGIPESLIVLKPEEIDASPSRFSFKFKIPVTDFTTEDEGLCLVNDKVIDIYVADPSVELHNNAAVIKHEDNIGIIGYTSSFSSFSNSADLKDVYSTNDLFPEEYKIKNIKIQNSSSVELENKVYIGTPSVTVSFDTTAFLRDICSSMYVAKNFGTKSEKILLEDASSPTVKFVTKLSSEKVYLVSTSLTGTRYIEEIPIKYLDDQNTAIVIEPLRQHGYMSSSSGIDIRQVKIVSKKIRAISSIENIGYNSSSSKIVDISREKLKIKQQKVSDIINISGYKSSLAILRR